MVVRVSIAGSGFGLYGLLPAFRSIEGCEVAGIYGKSSERLLGYCDKSGIKNYSDFEGMLKAEKPDAVAIAVVPRHQYAMARLALEEGIAVFAEKPLSLSVSDSRELCVLAEKAGLANMVDFIFPEIPEWAAAKESLDNGAIGRPLNVRVCWNFLSYDLKNAVKSWKTDPSEGGGALMFFSSHVLYYLEYFLGPIKGIRCASSTSAKSINGGETSVNLAVLFESGCSGSVSVDISYLGPQKHLVEFSGEEGVLLLENASKSVVDNFELTLANSKGTRRIRAERGLVQEEGEDERVKVVREIGRRFVGWCAGGAVSSPSFRDGLRVQELLEEARESDSSMRSHGH